MTEEKQQQQLSATGSANDKAEYRQCCRCVMDTSDPDIEFDADGHCSHCNYFDDVIAPRWAQARDTDKLAALIDRIKDDGAGKDHDCVVGLSGGVDSSYVALLAKRWGLKPLVVHVDAGWNSELAVNNIENVVNRLGFDLKTYVIDWEEMRDLQVAFMRSGVANLDAPQDHAFASSVYDAAVEAKIRYILSGSNFATESILPQAWGYNAMDARFLKSIHKKFGRGRLASYPTTSFFRQYIYLPWLLRKKVVRPLDMIDYVKEEAISELESELRWRRYDGKHYESRFTRFYQGYLLPTRFGYDKRKAHLSSLIFSGQMTREQALTELDQPAYLPSELAEDQRLFCKKLQVSELEFEEFLNTPLTPYTAFSNDQKLLELGMRLRGMKRRLARHEQ
jgi:N-acetyl sugar amidotransferase